MIRLALHLRYISFRANKRIVDRFSPWYISLLNKIKWGSIVTLRAFTLLQETRKMFPDYMLMIDEMHVKKATQYLDGKFVGMNEIGELYKDILVSLLLQWRIQFHFLSKQFLKKYLSGSGLMRKWQLLLNQAGFILQRIVTDKNSVIVSSFSIFKNIEINQPCILPITQVTKRIHTYFMILPIY